MGMLFRMLAPKPAKKIRRVVHPVSLLTPMPVGRAKMAVVNAANPSGAVKRAARREIVAMLRTPVTAPRATPTTRAAGPPWRSGVTASPPALPAVASDPWFVAVEAGRRAAIAEAAVATDERAQYEALSLANSFQELALESLREALDSAGSLGAERDALAVFGAAWIEESSLRWESRMERQNALVEILGRAECERIVEQRASPRMAEVKAAVMARLQDELAAARLRLTLGD
jgi:hypothetical protein